MSETSIAPSNGTSHNDLERIPHELRNRNQWALAGLNKAPRTASGSRASVTDPNTWIDFETARRGAVERGWHVGYILTADDPFACIDLDVKDDTTPERMARFQSIVNSFNSYSEFSRSGRGMHVWVRGKIGPGCKRDGVEVYSQERFIICTGNVYNDCPVKDRQEMLANMVSQMRGPEHSTVSLADSPEIESDQSIIARATAATNSEKFQALWIGDRSGYPTHSEADMALMSVLTFYSPNNEQVKRLFRMSALGKREKATKSDRYLNRTLSVLRGRDNSKRMREHGREIAANIVSGALMKLMTEKGATKIRGSAPELALIGEDEMLRRPPVRWRIRGVLPAEGLVAMYGPPGCGKSFLVLDMLGAISNGREWFGHRVRPAPVVYAALEGKAGVSQRLRAYRAKRGPMNACFIDAPIDLRRSEDRASIIKLIKDAGWANGVLCVDTLAASAPGMDENASTDMGALVSALHEVQAALGGCVLVIHHTGKDLSRGLRGWSGLTGAVDGAIEVCRTEDKREWRIAKSKDGGDSDGMSFDLDVVVLGMDEDGEPVTSCVIAGGAAQPTSDAVAEQVLSLIREFYARGEYVATAHNSPNSAYNVLRDDPKYPRTLNSAGLKRMLRDAERAGDLEREKYKDQYRNDRERWKAK